MGITPPRHLNIELLQALEDGFLAPFEIGDGGLETMPLAVEVTIGGNLAAAASAASRSRFDLV